MTEIQATSKITISNWLSRLQWWPSLVGLTFAGLASYEMTGGQDLAPVLAGSAIMYIGSSAIQHRASAWPIFFLSLVVGGVCSIVFKIDATFALVALGAVLILIGLIRHASRGVHSFPLQAVAMIVFGAAALFALAVDPTAGSYLVAFGLFAHAGWDIYHHWHDRVVSRSAAEFCFVLDIAAGLIILASVL